MAENSEFAFIQRQTTDYEPLQLEEIPLLPRSAWNSQLTYLKIILRAKQALDKTKQPSHFRL